MVFRVASNWRKSFDVIVIETHSNIYILKKKLEETSALISWITNHWCSSTALYSLHKICENAGSKILPLYGRIRGRWKPVFSHILCSY